MGCDVVEAEACFTKLKLRDEVECVSLADLGFPSFEPDAEHALAEVLPYQTQV